MDIDGDKKNELIVSGVCGNRGAPFVGIYEYDDLAGVPKITNPIYVRSSEFDYNKIPLTKIKTHDSWAACGIRWKTFESINGQYVLTELSVTDMVEVPGTDKRNCVTETFKRRHDGKLCLTKGFVSEWVKEVIEWFDKETKDHSKETCRHPPP